MFSDCPSVTAWGRPVGLCLVPIVFSLFGARNKVSSSSPWSKTHADLPLKFDPLSSRNILGLSISRPFRYFHWRSLSQSPTLNWIHFLLARRDRISHTGHRNFNPDYRSSWDKTISGFGGHVTISVIRRSTVVSVAYKRRLRARRSSLKSQFVVGISMLSVILLVF